MPPLSVLIADDEPLARALLRRYVERESDATVVRECRNGDELADALIRVRPAVALVDIRMPGRDVFEALAAAKDAAGRHPAVIFTTAYERYAVRAFELNAVDYLVKPIAADRFHAAFARVRERLRAGAADAAGLDRAVQDLGVRPTRLLVPELGRWVPIEVAAIDWIQAEGDYARVHAGGKSYLVSRTLTDLEGRLDPDRFARIHRSAIVNTDRIREVRPEGSQRHTVVLTNGTRLVLSRGRAGRLQRWRL